MSSFRFRVWPTETKIITQHFGARPDYYAQFGLPGHEGVDLAADPGTQIFAVASGVVDHVFPDDGQPYGINVRIRHGEGYQTIYAHLQEASVTEGQQVLGGQAIGLAGLTGNTDGPHLHLTVKQEGATLGTYPNNIIDPTPFLAPLLDSAWDDATFVRDTVPDGSIVGAEEAFTQSWFLRNTGNHAWGPGYTLTHVSGPTLNASVGVPLPLLPPGAEGPVSVAMIAPTQAGRHTSIWQPADANGKRFGDPVWVIIEVPAPALNRPATQERFVQVNERSFTVAGHPFRFFGYNLRGLAHYGQRTTDPLLFSRPEHQLTQLQHVYDLGARVVRLFLPDRDVTRNELEVRLGRLLDLIATHFPDLYLLPVFTNLYHDVPFHHPGDDQSWLFKNGLLSRDFFAERYRENYLPLVEQIVSAFRENHQIFAWEIGNELKLDRSDLNNPTDPNPWLFIHFNLTVAAAIKRLDPHHLVTTGMKSSHHAWLHTPALQEELYRSPNIDFLTIHSYEGKWDRDGDLRVYEDAALATRCNKPFIVEEAGFDRDLFPDRVAKHREHIEHWLGLGAQGYMPWGFIHAHEIGDSDDFVGISADHSDFAPLCELFRAYADQLNAGSRGLYRPFPPMLQPLALPRGIRGVAGFDFQGYNRHFITHSNTEVVNKAAVYGAGVRPVDVADGAFYWKVVGIHHLTPEENRSRHHIFVDVLDEAGNRVRDALVGWNWEGNQEPPPAPRRLDKPIDEPGCDIPLSAGNFMLWVMGVPSEEAFGFHYRHNGETATSGELFNSFGHHSFYVVFQRTRKRADQPIDGGDGTVTLPLVQFLNRISYVQAENLPIDSIVMSPGQPFVQQWTLRNNGATAWNTGYKVSAVAGASFGASALVDIPPCAPGSTVQVFVAFVAPTSVGRYQSTWRLCNERNEPFGDPITVVVDVVATRQLTPQRLPDNSSLEQATFQQLLRNGLASTQRIFAQLDATLDATPAPPVADSLTLAALGVTYHAYWAQVVGLTGGMDRAIMVNDVATGAINRINTLLGYHQARAGGNDLPTSGHTVLEHTALMPSITPPVPLLATGGAGRQRALCIGIDTYAQQPLAGCVADAQLWAKTLVTLGFAEPTLLLNEQATRANILAAIRALINSSQPGDVVVIQYAGHGTQLADGNGDERNGDTPHMDEALVPFDFFRGAFVLDDDLGLLFDEIPNGVNVTCFIDCCHSGSISRLVRPAGQPIADERVRFLIADPGLIEAHHRFRHQLGTRRTRSQRDLEAMREVVFSACQSSEVAWESNGQGEFTVRTTKLLQHSAGSLSHEAFMAQVLDAFGATPRQRPLLECATAFRSRMLLQPMPV